VPEAVVDGLETVKIDQEYRERSGPDRRFGIGTVQQEFADAGAVRQARETVVAGEAITGFLREQQRDGVLVAADSNG